MERLKTSLRVLLAVFCVASLAMGIWLLYIAATEMPRAGEKWGLVLVVVLGVPAMAVQLTLAVLSVFRANTSWAWKGPFRVMLLIGLASNLLAQSLVVADHFYGAQKYRNSLAVHKTGLYDAIVSGSVPDARAIIAGRPGLLSEHDVGGYTPLMLAVTRRDCAMARMLLEEGASPSEQASGHEDRTALHFATERNDAAMVELLLEHGADVNKGDESYRTALAIAGENGCREVEQILAKAGRPSRGPQGGGMGRDLLEQDERVQARRGPGARLGLRVAQRGHVPALRGRVWPH